MKRLALLVLLCASSGCYFLGLDLNRDSNEGAGANGSGGDGTGGEGEGASGGAGGDGAMGGGGAGGSGGPLEAFCAEGEALVPDGYVLRDADGQAVPLDAVFAGDDHACVLAAGRPYCWGSNASKQIDGSSTATILQAPSPILLPGEGSCTLGHVTDMSLGRGHTCAVLDTPTRRGVLCWGDIGFNGFASHDTPTLVQLEGSPLEAVEVGSGNGHACALTDPGEVVCFGENNKFKLGRGHSTTTLEAGYVLESEQGPRLDLATALAVGTNHTCVLADDMVATLLCWGSNDASAATPGGGPTVEVPTIVPEFAGATGVSAGSNTCVAFEGSVQCFGHNGALQTCPAGAAVDTGPCAIDDVGEQDLVAAGPNVICAVSEATGNVSCWGAGKANGSDSGSGGPYPILDSGSIAITASALGSGDGHVCAIVEAGTSSQVAPLQCWGTTDGNGVLGADTMSSATAVPICFGTCPMR